LGEIVAPVTAPATIQAVWNWVVYGALIGGFLAGMAAIVVLVVRSLRAWRELKRLRRGVARELGRLADLGEITADKLEAVNDTAELETSIARLRVDLARLAVLQRAVDESGDVFMRFAFVRYALALSRG
jgi:hypothetical protein